MSVYTSNNVLRITGTFRNISSTLTDPTAISFKYKKPGGSVVTLTYAGGTVSKTSTGIYYVDLTLDTVGKWPYRWEGTGAVVAASESAFMVNQSALD